MELYPAGPANVPADLTAPNLGYRLRVVAVMVSLLLFALLYLALVAGAAWLVWWVVSAGPPGFRWGVVLWLGAIAATGMLFAFMLKGLFRRRREDRSSMVEITAEEQPRLFDFLERLCADTGAPRPRRVYLTRDVNAAVFYDSSFLSLFWPVKKNLLIGLGLVNVLTLDELKAVLAHELGHFSQRSMRVGSYVYVASGVMEDMIFGRDKWDDLLAEWRRQDIRLAFFGWILTGVVWVIRKGLMLVFMGIHLAHSALSRQMEFHADSVAVSVTGSDSLVRALAKLRFADECLAFSMGELAHAGDHGLYSDNLFVHQTAAASHLRDRRREPTLGVPPDLPEDETRTVRVFDGESDDDAPSMWSSHPPNHEREENAKRLYLRSRLDGRSAWELFEDPEAVQRRLSEQTYREGVTVTAAAEVQAFIDSEHAATSFDPRWKGAYDRRDLQIDSILPVLDAEPNELGSPDAPLDELLGDDLATQVAAYEARVEELGKLRQVLSGAGPTRFSFRGEKRSAREAPEVLEVLTAELEDDRLRQATFDLEMFRIHRAMAASVGDGSEQELIDRYRFHARMCELSDRVSEGAGRVEDGLAEISQTSEPTEGQVDLCLDRMIDGWDTVAMALEDAESVTFPSLHNVEEGASVGSFLLQDGLVPRDALDDRMIDGMWLTAFFGQTSEVLDKLARVRRKSCSAIVSLHERIEGAYARRLTPPEDRESDR